MIDGALKTQARQLRDAADNRMTRRGHRMKWRRGHGQRWLKGVPGFTGRCQKCGDVVRVGAVGKGGAYRSWEDASGDPHGPRLCRKRQR